MKCKAFTLLVALSSSLPLVLGAQYLVGVGKDETTGKKGLGFDPSEIHPAVGDTIVWEFRSGQHSVVQSTFKNPCVGNGGINTGVQTVPDSLSVDAPGLPTYTITVETTEPQWFFDEAGGLCNQGAVLSVNPSGTQTGAAFIANAKKGSTSSPATSSSSEDSTSTSNTASKTAVAGSQTSSPAGSSSPTPTQTTPAAATTSNAAGHVAQSSGMLLGALSFLVWGMF
ncbi:hypothetical protein DXG01_005206 [Tephrocybe rancida]|nr:hypothetical protein DXG01_005206 [Tephrocybe rancida]